MRNCPVCEGDQRQTLGAYLAGYTLYECSSCGMRYLDADHLTQKDFDAYYVGDTSADLHEPDSIQRLRSLADVITHYGGRGVDIGGKWCFELREMVPGLEAIGAGEPLVGVYDYFVISHTLEHVYDVHGLMRDITAHAAPGARIVIEIPYWPTYDLADYDYFYQHCNKFTGEHLLKLLQYHGWVATGAVLPPFQHFHCYRAEGILESR